MEVTTKKYTNCDVVKIDGRIDSSSAPELEQTVSAITDKGRYNLIIDLADVDFMSSAGLRILISAQKTCKKNNRGEVVLAQVPENINNALELSGFVTLFKFFDNMVDAVGYF